MALSEHAGSTEHTPAARRLPPLRQRQRCAPAAEPEKTYPDEREGAPTPPEHKARLPLPGTLSSAQGLSLVGPVSCLLAT